MINNPTIPAKDNPKLIDAALIEVNSVLSNLTWLDNRFGKCENLIDGKGRDEKRFPAVYTGSKNNKGYLKLLPDSHLENFSFFHVSNQTITAIPHQGEIIDFDFGLIVWFNFTKVYPNTHLNKTIENVKSEVLSVLNSYAYGVTRITIEGVTEEANEIYRGFTVSEIDNQFLMRPYGGFRVNGSIKYITNICE